jgi:hypothetical protein
LNRAFPFDDGDVSRRSVTVTTPCVQDDLRMVTVRPLLCATRARRRVRVKCLVRAV